MSTTLRKEETAMEGFKKVLVLVAVVALGFGAASCSREITYVDQPTPGPQGCFECHSDTTTFLVAAAGQWENSKHASGGTLNENERDCKGCHTSEGFVARATGKTAPATIDNPTAIHCFTCHAPHTNGDFQLRWNSIATLQDGAQFDLGAANICVACHRARYDVATQATNPVTLRQRWGPHHGVQGDMLIGSNGYEYDGYSYERTNHRSVTEDGCLDCHFKTGVGYVVGGHSFNMESELGGEEVRNLAGCADCHGELDDFNHNAVQDSVDMYAGQLKGILEGAGLIGSDGLPLAVTTSADSAGAVWNYLMAIEDRSHGVHNPKYILGLLKSAIQYMQRAPEAVAFLTAKRTAVGR
jgi:hypothetical protein